MNRLHRSQHTEPRESRYVGGRDDLGVLDSEAGIRCLAVAGKRFLKSVEHLAIRRIADGMHCDLKPFVERAPRQRIDAVCGRCHDTFIARVIAVRLEQGGAARPERSVSEELKAPDGKQVAVAIYLGT